MKPDATIIIPAWNAARVIDSAIASSLAQRGVAFEVVVADDASTDQTGQVVAPFCGPLVRYLRLPRNGGPSAARNAAFAEARGRWIAVLDADDSMKPDRLSTLISSAETEQLDIITDNMWITSLSAEPVLFVDEALDGSIERLDFGGYVRRNLMFGATRGDGYLKPVFRADFLRQHDLRYDQAMRIGEDFMLMAEALALGARYGRHRSAGYVYTTGSGSISHRLSEPQAAAMVDADLRFLANFGDRLSASDRAAMHLHLSRLRDGAGFVAMVDAIKAGDVPRLVREAVRRPGAVRHFKMPVHARLAKLGLVR